MSRPSPSLCALVVCLASCGPGADPAGPGAASAPALPEEQAGGKWSPAPVRAPLPGDPAARVTELEALGYADAVRAAPEVVSVTRHDPERAAAGLNFFVSGHACEAYLVDMQGGLVHRWGHPFELLEEQGDGLWPELDVPPDAAGRGKWRRAELLADGGLLAIHEGIGMVRLDRESRLLWAYPGKTHHDLQVMDDGRIWTLAREELVIPRLNAEVPCMDDYLVELSAEGEELQRISVLECLENGGEDELLARMKREKELFHTNSIEVLDGRVAERVGAFAAGNLLISLRHLDAIAVIDPRQRQSVWSLTGGFVAQHDPKVLANGHLLLFDNRGKGEISTVLELDPATGAVLWEYSGTPDDPFYSKTCGTAYRLANGNTLINESDGGRAFELAPDGAIVWEFYNPHRGGRAQELIACLYDLQRVPADLAWLE